MTRHTQRNAKFYLLGSASAFLMAAGAQAAYAEDESSAAAANDDLALVEEAQVQTQVQQQQQQQQADEALELEEIVVTGSRIRRSGLFETSKPTIAIGEERFAERNYVNVFDALAELPQFSDGVDNVGPQGGNAGESFADLFGLGTQRTLTLINGRRVIGGNGGGGAQVDLNIIPTALIERIDTVSVGGAPLYGTDAIAGTVNVILKDDFEGLEVTGQFGVTEQGDGAEKRFSAVWGGNFADGRGNVNLSFEFVDFNFVEESDRRDLFFGNDFVVNPANTGPTDGIPDEILIDDSRIFVVTFGGFPLLSDFQLQNAFTGDNQTTFPLPNTGGLEAFLSTPVLNEAGQATQFGPNGTLIPFDAGTPSGQEFAFGRGGDGIPISVFDEIRVPTQRINTAANAHFDVTDNIRMFGEFIFSTQDNFDPTNQPFIAGNLFPGDEREAIGLPLSNPFLSNRARTLVENSLSTANDQLAANELILLENGVLGADANGNGIPENLDTDGDGVPDSEGIFLSRFTRDLLDGLQSFENETDTYRFVAGLEGDFELGDRQFNWEFSYNFGRNEGNQELPVRLVDQFFQAVNAVELTEDNIADLGGTVNAIRGFRPGEDIGEVVQVDASTARPGDIVCSNTLDPSVTPNPGLPNDVPALANVKTGPANCVPLNLFGENNAVPEAQNFVTAIDRTETNQEQETVEFNLSGDIIELPAGPLQFATGILYRDESFEFSPGAVTQFGLNGTSPVDPTLGSFQTWEGYFEANIPVISRDMDFLDFAFFDWMLEFNGAVRAVGNNSPGTGTDVTYTAGGRISPFEDVVFRGNYTRAVRAPAVGELFDPVIEFADFAQDPCDADELASGPNPQNRQANCRRRVIELGLADNAAEADAFLSTFQNISGNASQNIFTGGGNPNLGNEISNSFTVGAQWTPHFIPGLTLAVDWSDIELSNAIFDVDQDSVLSSCFDASPASFPPEICDNLQRNANTFQLSRVETGFANIGFWNFAGLTGRGEYTNSLSALPFVPEGDYGTFRLATNMQYIDQNENSVLGTGDDLDIFKGTATDPEFEITTTFNYDYHAFHFLLQMNWKEKTALDPQATDEARDISTIPDFTEFQTTLGYDITENINARFTIDNFTDAKVQPQAVAFGFADQFDLLGRRFSFRVTARY